MFNIGQKVICVDDKSQGESGADDVIEGRVYTVYKINTNICCGANVVNVFPNTNNTIYTNMTCGNCRKEYSTEGRWHKEQRFVPLQDLNEELSNLLKQAIDEDRQFCREVDARTRTILSGDAA